MVADDGVEGEVLRADTGVELLEGVESGGAVGAGGQGQVVWTDDAVFGFEEGSFQDAGELADVAGPTVLEEAGEGAGAEDDGAMLVACAEAVEEGLGEQRDVFAALAERGNGEADGGEAEGEVGHEQALTGHLAEGGLRRGEDDGAAWGAVLKAAQYAEEESLSGRGEQVDTVEVGETGEGGGVSVGDEPLAGVAALEARPAKGERPKMKRARVCLPMPGSPSMAATCRWGAAISACMSSLRQAALTPTKGFWFWGSDSTSESEKAEGWVWKWPALCMGLNVPRLRGPKHTLRANKLLIGEEGENMNGWEWGAGVRD